MLFARFFFLFVLLLIPLFGHSAIIVKIKGNRCFVHLEGSQASVGDYMEALDLFGKPRGIIRLDKVRNGKAIATIVDGQAGVNWLLEHTNQQKLKSPETVKSGRKNKIGLLGSGHSMTVIKKIQETLRHKGWGMGGSAFFDWSFHKLLSLNIASGVNYYIINRESSGDRGGIYRSSNYGWMHIIHFPQIQLSLKLYIPIFSNTFNLWVSAGANVSKWNNFKNEETIFAPETFKFQPAGQFLVGLDINIPNTKYTIPISFGYAKVQWGGEQLDKLLGRDRYSDPNSISLDISELIVHIGISQDI